MAASVTINQGGKVAAALTLQNTGGQSATVMVMMWVNATGGDIPFTDSTGNAGPTTTIAPGQTSTLNLMAGPINVSGDFNVLLSVQNTVTGQAYISQAPEGTVTVLSPANVVVQSISLSAA